jgi:hypothetical protein
MAENVVTNYTEATTFRPRNGLPAEAYWRIREWCEKNGFTLSDVLNAIVVPLAYYLENHCLVDKQRSMATVELMAGPVDILHVFNGKCYPLASQTNHPHKNTLSLEDIRMRVAFWHQRNKTNPTHADIVLLATNPRAQEKLRKRNAAA